MCRTKYIVINNNSYEYDIYVSETKKGKLFELYHSEEEFWSNHIRGTLAMTLLDNGNGVKLSHAKKNMPYDEFEEMRILINFSKTIYDNIIERESKTQIYQEGDNLESTPVRL